MLINSFKLIIACKVGISHEMNTNEKKSLKNNLLLALLLLWLPSTVLQLSYCCCCLVVVSVFYDWSIQYLSQIINAAQQMIIIPVLPLRCGMCPDFNARFVSRYVCIFFPKISGDLRTSFWAAACIDCLSTWSRPLECSGLVH
jgi:hypothetical protein